MLLADLGADVVKVERPGGGDDTRAWGPPFAPDGTATYFLSVNRNKRSVALDLRAPEDVALAKELIRRADVVVENFLPGTMERFGLGYEEVGGGIRAWSTARSPASATARAPTSPATTCWCRRSAG